MAKLSKQEIRDYARATFEWAKEHGEYFTIGKSQRQGVKSWCEKFDLTYNDWQKVKLEMIRMGFPIVIYSRIGHIVGENGAQGRTIATMVNRVTTQIDRLIEYIQAIAESGHWYDSIDAFQERLKPDFKDFEADQVIAGLLELRKSFYETLGVAQQLTFDDWAKIASDAHDTRLLAEESEGA